MIFAAKKGFSMNNLPGPKAQAIINRDKAVISPSYTRAYPLVVARGDGAMIEDVDGNRFLDLNAGIAVAATGLGRDDGWLDDADGLDRREQ